MKRYILLGIGIGIIFTNIMFSFFKGENINIEKRVEEEVQKRLKNIENYQKVEESFREVVKKDEMTTSQSIGQGVEEESVNRVLFPGESGAGAIYYLYFYNTNVEKTLVETKKKLDELLDTKIEKKGNIAYLFSEHRYTSESIKELLEIIKNEYNLKVRRVTDNEMKQLMGVNVTKPKTTSKIENSSTTVSTPTPTPTVSTATKPIINTTTTQSLGIKTEQVNTKIESTVKETIKEEPPKEQVKEAVKEEALPKE